MADGDLVIGLDSSTQGTKAIAWSPAGRAVAEGRAAIPLSSPALGHYEQDPEDWWRAARTAIAACMREIAADRVAGLCVSNQRETVAFLDADGRAIHPAIVWLDERARWDIGAMTEVLGADTIHRITGRPPDLTPCLYRLAWMRRNAPSVYDRTVCFADVQCYLVGRLTGEWFRTGWSSADPLGLFDVEAKQWSAPILAALGLGDARLPQASPPGTVLGRIVPEVGEELGLSAGTPVLAGSGDGQCAGLGTNCTRPDRCYINLGTAAVAGVWSPDYRYDRAWRTEIAAQGDGYILENCLRTGAFLIDWFVDRFAKGERTDPATFERLETEALALPVGSDGLLVQPYWSGAMDPHWDPSARGVIIGLTGGHSTAHIYRAVIEGITLDQAMRTRALEAASGRIVDHFVAIGGGAASPLWRQILADATGKPVHVSETIEASSLGAAMIAAFGAGWYSSIGEAAERMVGPTWPVRPDREAAARYGELLDIYQMVYGATAAINQRLLAFTGEGAC